MAGVRCGAYGIPAALGAADCAAFTAPQTGRASRTFYARMTYVRKGALGNRMDFGASNANASRVPAWAARNRGCPGGHRGLTVTAPRFTVIERAARVDHGGLDKPT